MDKSYPCRNSIDVEGVITFLNDLLLVDRETVSQLLAHRIPCSHSMADHPSVQVIALPGGENMSVGFLGILNGMFGIDEEGWGQIAMEVADDDVSILHFYRTSPLRRKYGPCLS